LQRREAQANRLAGGECLRDLLPSAAMNSANIIQIAANFAKTTFIYFIKHVDFDNHYQLK
jgi:hypothetical protein